MSVDLKMTQAITLPKRVYDRAPIYWLLLGILLIVVGAYLGYQVRTLFYYVGGGFGLSCIGWSAFILARREEPRPAAIIDPDLDQTCELNYRPD